MKVNQNSPMPDELHKQNKINLSPVPVPQDYRLIMLDITLQKAEKQRIKRPGKPTIQNRQIFYNHALMGL